MLTEEEKKHIREEEIFRHEVRQQLEARPPDRSRWKTVWSALNSAFVLWLLGAVVVAGLAGLFARYQEGRAEAAQRTATERRLNTEIGSRIADGLVGLRLWGERIEAGLGPNTLPSWIYGEALSYLNNRVTNEGTKYDFSVYPNYKERGLPALLVELSVVAEHSRLPELSKALADYKQLEASADQAVTKEALPGAVPADKAVLLQAVRDSTSILLHLQRMGFAHLQLERFPATTQTNGN